MANHDGVVHGNIGYFRETTLISRIEGQTQGLKAGQIKRLKRLYRRRVSPDQVIGLDLAHELSDISTEIGRQVGLLIDRTGSVDLVLLGDQRAVYLPEMGRGRASLTRLKGVRLVHTHLHGQGLDQEDVNDLAALRLDLIAALLPAAGDHPPAIEAAYLLPGGDGGDGVAKAAAPHPGALDIDFAAFIRSLEDELARRQDEARTTGGGERAMLISLTTRPRAEAEERLDELAELADTAGLQVIDRVFFRMRPDQKGPNILSQARVQDLNVKALQTGVDLLVFDLNLNPAQVNRLTKLTELRIIDRTQLILDIFAQRAQSREGQIQVEMAQLQYLLPRLAYKNTAMSRLTGGIGARGPGETKLEINRRRVRERIARLKRDLDQVKKQRGRHRGRRAKAGLPIVSIVGYTNAGKSTLLNRLTNSDILAEDRLFATLDPTSRRLRFPQDRSIIITDTVGFIRELPADLFDAFAATLEELSSADLLLHVIDAANPNWESQVKSVEKLLEKLELGRIPVLPVFNKMDLAGRQSAEDLAFRQGGVAVSALDSSTFPPLIQEIERRFGWAD